MNIHMQLQVNANTVKDRDPIRALGGGTILITPPISEGFWLARVPVSLTQAVVAFPKFGLIGIGFQHEEDWNTNLPASCSAVEIYDHIKHNKNCRATRKECIAAIELLREWARKAS